MLDQLLSQILEDDLNIPTGGVSYPDETLEEFLEEINQPIPQTIEEYYQNLDKYNKMLQECGICIVKYN